MNDLKENKVSFFQQAAKASWVSVVLIVVVLMFSGRVPQAKLILELLIFLIAILGFVFGVIAMFGISKEGINKILWPALVGILLNGLLLFIGLMNIITSYNLHK